MNELPEQYVVNKFYEFSNQVNFQKSSNSYRGGCPSCREGDSWGRKTRLNYYLDQGFLVCYNCQNSWNPLRWVQEQTGMSYKEVLDDSSEYDSFNLPKGLNEVPEERPKNPHTLPHNSINLSDDVQLRYYSDSRIVNEAMSVIKDRRLDVAINSCETFYVSLDDFIHKNRLCLPFYDSDGKIRFFQTRAIYKQDEKFGKYLSKTNADKTVFGLNKVKPDLDFMFCFEGPIDSMFVQNGISMGGLHVSDVQTGLLNKYMLHEKIWILDNQLENPEVYKKNLNLIEKGERIFLWPKKYKQFKDLNQLCCKFELNSIDPNFFIENSYSGEQAKMKLSMTKLYI